MPQEKRPALEPCTPCPTGPSRKRVQLAPDTPRPADSTPTSKVPASPDPIRTPSPPLPTITPKSFYGTPTFVPPALHPGRGRLSALRASRNDPARVFRVFPAQQPALDFCDAHPSLALRVWAFEIDGQGRRRYVAASYASFWRAYARFLRRGGRLHFYEVIRSRHASKLYFDLEFLRAHNAGAEPERMVDALVQACAELSGREVRREGEDVVELDSTTRRKFSRHLVFQRLAFHDNVQAGEFARRVVQRVAEREEGLVMVRAADGAKTAFVDLGVYTKNRCFRLVGSSKFGKEQRLVQRGAGQKGRVGVSKRLFVRALVCSVEAGVELMGCVSPMRGVAGGGGGGGRGGGGAEFRRVVGEKSAYPAVDEYVRALVGGAGGGIYGVTVVSGAETVMYAIRGGYKYCGRVGRHHRSNNVILIADLRRGEMYQKCFDPDCRGYRSEAWAMPVGGGGYIDADVSDAWLNEVMDGMERGFDGGVADEELNRVMDQLSDQVADEELNRIMDQLSDQRRHAVHVVEEI